MPTLTMVQSEPAPVLLEWALYYASLGWHVFPLHTPDGGRCDCRRDDCRRSGKHPRTMHGKDDATTAPATIERWWGMWPTANIGISCEPSGLAVLDIDPRHGGDESFRDLQEEYPDADFNTARSITGSGGMHYVFRAPPQGVRSGAGTFGPGLDVRGLGGYIVAPPSLHEQGNEYEWEVQPSEIDLLLWPSIEPKGKGRSDAGIIGETIADGERDDTLTSIAGTMRRRGMSEIEILESLRVVNRRCVPPVPEADLQRIARSVSRYEPGKDIRGGTGNVTRYESLRVIATDPPSYLLAIDGEDVRLSDPEIGRHEAVRAAARRQLYRMPPRMKPDEWDSQLNALLQTIEILPAPEDASLDGLIWAVITSYFRQYVTDDGENFPARPVRQGDTIIASGALLRSILNGHGIKATQPEIWNVVRRHGGVSQSVRFGQKVHRGWVIPKPEDVE